MAGDYETIRRTLDTPRRVVLDPCAPWVATWTPDLTPGAWMTAKELLVPLHRRIRLRCLLVAACEALRLAAPPDAAPLWSLARSIRWRPTASRRNRAEEALATAIRLVRRQLHGDDVRAGFDARPEGARLSMHATEAQGTVRGVTDSLLDTAARIDRRSGQPMDAGDVLSAGGQASVVANVARLHAGMVGGDSQSEIGFVVWWWARCRALLPIRDLLHAEIEWWDLPEATS